MNSQLSNIVTVLSRAGTQKTHHFFFSTLLSSVIQLQPEYCAGVFSFCFLFSFSLLCRYVHLDWFSELWYLFNTYSRRSSRFIYLIVFTICFTILLIQLIRILLSQLFQIISFQSSEKALQSWCLYLVEIWIKQICSDQTFSGVQFIPHHIKYIHIYLSFRATPRHFSFLLYLTHHQLF